MTRVARSGTIVTLIALGAGGVWIGVRAASPAVAPGAAAPAATALVAIVRTDLSTTQQVGGTLGYAGTYAVIDGEPSGTVTALPALGQVIARGQTVFEVDGRAVTLLYGARPPWRGLGLGVVPGPDVTELEENLLALGYATPSTLTADGVFGAADAAAVRRWQAARGVTQTGVVSVGDAVFEPGPLRVADVHAGLGDPVHAGMAVVAATSTDRVVNVALPVADAALVTTGDAVQVELPDGRTSATGRISTVSSVATVAQDTSRSGSGPPQPTIAVTVTLNDPTLTGSLDQAPVTVSITDRSVQGVLAVPVNALVAPADGGFAVEVVENGRHRLVAVHPGLFANTMVEITGPGLAAGMSVVVPAP